MLAASLLLVLDLPPLAFGSGPFPTFATPRELVCSLSELAPPLKLVPVAPPGPAVRLDPRALRPAPKQHPANPMANSLLLMATAYGTRAMWDDRTWSTKAWAQVGAAAPVLIPPQAPPMWAVGR